MRCDQRLERGRRPASRTALALAFVLGLWVAPVGAADRRDLRPPEPSPALPESDLVLELPPPAGTPGDELTLLWFDPRELVPQAFGPVSREVTGIFNAIGVGVRWERAGSDTVFGERGGVEIPVILLPADPSTPRASRRVLGLVPKDPNSPRAVWAFLDNVRWTLGHNPGTAISRHEQAELGLALARVVAHEVVHAIAPEEPHTASGLMHRSMDRRFLLGARAPIDPGCARVFSRSLVELISPAGHATEARAGENRAPGP